MYTTCALGGIAYGTGQRNEDLSPESTMKAMRVSFDMVTFWRIH